MPIRIQGFDDKNFKKKYSRKKNLMLFDQHCNLVFRQDVHCASYRRTFSPQSQKLKTWKFLTFSVFEGHFCPPDSDPSRPNSMRIRTPSTEFCYHWETETHGKILITQRVSVSRSSEPWRTVNYNNLHINKEDIKVLRFAFTKTTLKYLYPQGKLNA
jgi:hypothetical protein